MKYLFLKHLLLGIKISFLFFIITFSCDSIADDTEIFLPIKLDDTRKNVNPNILFIIDTSGSMTEILENNKSRMEQLKTGLIEVLKDIQDVNVGLMRFNRHQTGSKKDRSRGGPILFPIQPISGDIGGEQNVFLPKMIFTIKNNASDWMATTERGKYFTARKKNYFKGLPYSSRKRSYGIGLHFDLSRLPKGMPIQSAYLSVKAANTTSDGKVNIRIRTRKTKHAFDDIFRAKKTPFNWFLKEWKKNKIYQSPNIASLIQKRINYSSWKNKKQLSFFLKGIRGKNGIYAHNYNPKWAPKLIIHFSPSSQPLRTNRQRLKKLISELPAQTWTATSDTFAEAGRYFRGEKVFHGLSRYGYQTNRTSHPKSFKNGVLDTPKHCSKKDYSGNICRFEKIKSISRKKQAQYISPIKHACQKNYIIYISDGEPNAHHRETNRIYKKWTQKECTSSSTSNGKDCAYKLAQFFNQEDQNTQLPGKQTIQTRTIIYGSNEGKNFLTRLAAKGGGEYFVTHTKKDLVKALKTLINDPSNNNALLSSAISVDHSNRLTHNNDVYYSLFEPDYSYRWKGNLKKYLFKKGKVVDQNGELLLKNDGVFNSDAQGFWSKMANGNSILLGGAAHQREKRSNVYSNLSHDVHLSRLSNRVHQANSTLTQELLGVTSEVNRNKLLNWIEGQSLLSKEPHHRLGAALHSQPHLLSYNYSEPDSKSKTIKTHVFIGTTDGFLHAFDSKKGHNVWSFIPKSLLSSLSSLVEKDKPLTAQQYGLDGGTTIYFEDKNNNHLLDIKNQEKAYLYIGMRRGGAQYYAFDISNPEKPKLQFIIKAEDNFLALGQTWSTPIVKKIKIQGREKLVLLFGGGYDTTQDEAGKPSQKDTQGNVVYIADALTGEYLWDSKNAYLSRNSKNTVSSMNSVPASIRALDLDGDGFIEHFYSVDTKGQVFRFDIDDTKKNLNEMITGKRIARLQNKDNNTLQSNRRFYYQPDTALIRLKNEIFVSVSIGSGYRAHPLNTDVKDRFYMLKDKDILYQKNRLLNAKRAKKEKSAKKPHSSKSTYVFNEITEEQLIDIKAVSALLTSNKNRSEKSKSKAIEQFDTPSNNQGWYLRLNKGEKVLAKAITFNNAIFFTTYTPRLNAINICFPDAESRLYAVNVENGKGLFKQKNNLYSRFKVLESKNNAFGTPRDGDSGGSKDPESPGIPGMPTIRYSDGGFYICVAGECKTLDIASQGLIGRAWRSSSILDSVESIP
jgi:type IV pilus assembly protein PilY1